MKQIHAIGGFVRTGLLVFILLGMVGNLLMTMQIMSRLALEDVRHPLPCPAIPTRFVLEEPACAQRLLEAMNVTNVRIVPTIANLGKE